MYGETDLLTGEWTQGVFSALWEKYNNRSNAYITWIVCDGPVDTIWVESMNTVLDDNKMLTLASGDRIAMTDNTKLMFENEHLVNASPATVSRAGIVFVSDVDLGWLPIVDAWALSSLAPDRAEIMQRLFRVHVGEETPAEPGVLFPFLHRHTAPAITVSRMAMMTGCCHLLGSLIAEADPELAQGSTHHDALEGQLERLLLYCLTWSVGGVLEAADRLKWDANLRRRLPEEALPPTMSHDGDQLTLYDFYVDLETFEWRRWRAPKWTYPGPSPNGNLVSMMHRARAGGGGALRYVAVCALCSFTLFFSLSTSFSRTFQTF